VVSGKTYQQKQPHKTTYCNIDDLSVHDNVLQMPDDLTDLVYSNDNAMYVVRDRGGWLENQ
jgi:hypothetical protein